MSPVSQDVFSILSAFGHFCLDSLTAVTWLWLLRFPHPVLSHPFLSALHTSTHISPFTLKVFIARPSLQLGLGLLNLGLLLLGGLGSTQPSPSIISFSLTGSLNHVPFTSSSRQCQLRLRLLHSPCCGTSSGPGCGFHHSCHPLLLTLCLSHV